jgi:hypothetical protein
VVDRKGNPEQDEQQWWREQGEQPGLDLHLGAHDEAAEQYDQ